jgi:hypothetical protein
MGSGRMHLYMLDFLIFVTLRRRSLKERFPEVKSMLLAWLPEAEATTSKLFQSALKNWRRWI